MGKKTIIAAGLSAAILMLSGCDQINTEKWEPQEPSAITISDKGTITEYVNDTLDEAFYDSAELQDMISTEIAAYNKENGEDSIVMKKFTAEDKSVHLEMEYAGTEDYAKFNNVEFFYGSMINAQLEGYLFDVSFKKVKNGVVTGSSVTGSEVVKNMAAEVLVVHAPLEVHVPGTVLYTSSNAEVLGTDTVNATGEADQETESALELPSSAVYTAEDEATFDEALAADRVYIIFEK